MIPKRMMLGDKIFFSITFFILIGLFWLRFLDKHIPVWASLFASIPLAVYIFRLEDPVKARKREKEKLLKRRNLI